MDMLVPLYSLPKNTRPEISNDDQFSVRRAVSYEKHAVLETVEKMFPNTPAWRSECDIAFSRQPIGCFIATIGRKMVGFSCYGATFKGFFGPVGVCEVNRQRGIGATLTLRALSAMAAEGYAYAVIGQVADPAFFTHVANATAIENSMPGAYALPVA